MVVFTDGPSPRLASMGESDVHGPLELEVRFRNVNPLCYAYSTNIAASHMAASDQTLPERAPGVATFGSTAPSTYSSVDEAFAEVNSSLNELDELLHAARVQASLEDVWASCDAGSSFEQQKSHVDSASKTIASRLGPGGSWRLSLEQAEAASLGAKRLVRGLALEERSRADDVDEKRGALKKAEQAAAVLEAQAERGGRARAMREKLESAERDIASAQRAMRESELAMARQRHAVDLGRAAEQLGERVRVAVESLGAMVADVNRARALLAQSPTAIRRRFASGESVSVSVTRTRLERGEVAAGAGKQVFEVAKFRTLSPLILDIGLGPALPIGQNTAKYETLFAPRDRGEPDPTWRVVRTEQGLNLDMMLSISAYIWKRRYLDDRVIDAWQFIPRPMVGISLSRPVDVLYAGLVIDPIQYLNIGGGVRIGTENELVGPQPLDRALVDQNGEPQPPVTRDEVKVRGFVSLTVSTNLIYRWIQQGL